MPKCVTNDMELSALMCYVEVNGNSFQVQWRKIQAWQHMKTVYFRLRQT